MQESFVLAIIFYISVPVCAFFSKEMIENTSFKNLLQFPDEKLTFFSKTNGAEDDSRKVIDVSIGTNSLSTKLTSGISTFAAYTGISVKIVTVTTIVIIAFPFVILLIYLSLVVIFPDPVSPVQFERDVAVTVKHLQYMAADVEDRVFDFLEEITDPSKYKQEYPPSMNYGSNQQKGYHSNVPQSVPNYTSNLALSAPYRTHPSSDAVDSYVQYSSNQKRYQTPLHLFDGHNILYAKSDVNLVPTSIFVQKANSQNLVRKLPFKYFQYSANPQNYQPQVGHGLYNHSKDTRRLASYDDQSNSYLLNTVNGDLSDRPLSNIAIKPPVYFSPLYNTVTKTPLIDLRGETIHSINMQLDTLAQLKKNPYRGYQAGKHVVHH